MVDERERPADDAFASVADDLVREPGIKRGTGFGENPGLRAGGRIFAMFIAGALVVKLPAERVAALAESGDARPFHVGKRQMREWVALAHGGPHDWAVFAREALAFVRAG